MTVLLSILLYLAAIVSPGTYHVDEIYALEQQHQPEIQAVHSDQQLFRDVTEEFGPQTEYLHLMGWDEGEE